MSEQLIPEAKLAVPNTKSLELLFDYTKMHIGIYVTLTAAYAAFGDKKIDSGALG